MKTEISRDSHRPERDYAGVFQQQGRMLTDADWNELVAIIQTQLRTILGVVVGSGTPRSAGAGLAAGFELQPGLLVADGLSGRLRAPAGADAQARFAYGDQRFPIPALPAPPRAPLRFYADVWDRPVTALEDPALRDPALRGADTCTRTQRVVQIKWCPLAVDPRTLPTRGDARLTLSARVDDELEARVDPHLFRLEVHVAAGAPGQRRLTLKWSTENGAIAHDYGQRPPPADFLASDFVYEFYAEADEQQLGWVHPDWTDFPSRGLLARGDGSWSPPADASKRYVRRWDGCCRLIEQAGAEGQPPTWILDPAEDAIHVDRATPLSTATGNLRLRDGGLEIDLGPYTLRLELDGRQFLVGQHWLVAVREGESDGPHGFADAQPPSGVDHAYLDLGSFTADGSLSPRDLDDRLRLTFPSLTELDADAIDYDPRDRAPRWNKDCRPPATVQAALDCLVEAKVSRSGDSMSGRLLLDGGLPAKEMLEVRGHAKITERATVGDALAVGRVHEVDRAREALTVFGSARVTGGARIEGSARVDDTLVVGLDDDEKNEPAKQALTVFGNAHVTGGARIDDGLVVGANALVHQSLTIKGDLHVMGATYEHTTEQVKGDVVLGDADSDVVTISGTLRSAHSTGKLLLDDALLVRETLEVGGSTTLGQRDSDTTTVHGPLRSVHSSDWLLLDDAVRIREDLEVRGATHLKGGMQLDDALVIGVEGATPAKEMLTVFGHVRIHDTLFVTNAKVKQSLDVDTLFVTNAKVKQSLTVDGTFHANASVRLGDADRDAVTISGTLRSAHGSGQLRLEDALYVGESLEVCGATHLAGGMQLDDALVIGVKGATPAKELLTVFGHVRIHDTLFVTNAKVNQSLDVDALFVTNAKVKQSLTVDGTFHANASVRLGDADGDAVTISGTLRSAHSTGQLVVADAIVSVGHRDPARPLAGLAVTRGSQTPAQLLWDEERDLWVAGPVGPEQSLQPIGGGQTIVTGVVRFEDVGQLLRESPSIQPQLGSGPLELTLGLVDGDQITIDELRARHGVQVWARLFPADGSFRIDLRRDGTPNDLVDLSIRWWASLPTREAPTITVPGPPLTVSIDPPGPIELSTGDEFEFTATVQNAHANAGVTWSVTPRLDGLPKMTTQNPLTGTVPDSAAGEQFTLTAKSQEDPSKSASVLVTITSNKNQLKDAKDTKAIKDTKDAKDNKDQLKDNKDEKDEKLLLKDNKDNKDNKDQLKDLKDSKDDIKDLEDTPKSQIKDLKDGGKIAAKDLKDGPIIDARNTDKDFIRDSGETTITTAPDGPDAPAELGRAFIRPEQRPKVGEWRPE